MNFTRFFVPVMAAASLCGCASGPATDFTRRTDAGKVPVRKVDFSEAPEMKELAEHARQIGNEVYPKIVAILHENVSKAPRQFDIVFKKRLEGNFGQTLGTTIRLRADWFAENPNDVAATLVHEMAHVAQQYRSKAWDYWGEGIADYVCCKLGYTNGWNWPHCSDEYPHYTSGYRCAGAFLLYTDATYGSNIVRQLNTALRRGSYSDAFFAKATGSRLDELWAEFQRTPAFTPAAAEANEIRQALGYVNGQPPKDVEARSIAYLEEQPGGALTLDALEFVEKLVENRQLPGILKEESTNRFSLWIGFLELRKGSSSATYPAARAFYGKNTNDPYTYHYVVVRETENSGWKLKKAQRTAPGGRVIEEYPLP